MYKKIENYFSFKDERGEIKGLIDFDNWQEVNQIMSKQGSVRGGHYHKKTKEAIIVLTGEIEAMFEKDGNSETILLKANDVIIITPLTKHTFTMKKDSSWINLLSDKMNKNCADIYKV